MANPIILLLCLCLQSANSQTESQSENQTESQTESQTPNYKLTGQASIDGKPILFLENPFTGNNYMVSQLPDTQNNYIIDLQNQQGTAWVEGQKIQFQTTSTQEIPYNFPCKCDFYHDPSNIEAKKIWENPINDRGAGLDISDPSYPENLPEGVKNAIQTRKAEFEEILESTPHLKDNQVEWALQDILPLYPPVNPTTPCRQKRNDLFWTVPSKIVIRHKDSGEIITLIDESGTSDKPKPPPNNSNFKILHRLMLPNLEENQILINTGSENMLIKYSDPCLE